VLHPRSILLALALVAARALAADALPGFDADTREVTVSGVSSGGYMAVQFHVAHSRVVRGAGAVAAGPYDCARGSAWTASFNCMSPSDWFPLPAMASLKSNADALARARAIDPTEQLTGARVWLFSGTRDRTVAPGVVTALRDFYAAYMPPANIAFVRDRPAGHGMVTADAGVACGATETPFINDCDYDAAGALLAHLLNASANAPAAASGPLLRFDQASFAGGDAYAISLDDAGYAYVPQACAAERCRVHVAFHGCRQGAEAIGERFVREAGYNRWADAHRLIVLYPQAIARYGWGFHAGRASFAYNPRGCWDWWGYTGSQYATQAGAQVKAVKAMLDRLSAPRK
jgi:poly(3-hydroxybutyrate) depolymerase